MYIFTFFDYLQIKESAIIVKSESDLERRIKMAGELNSKAQDIAMQIIAYAGDGKTKAFEALRAARNGDLDLAKKLIAESNKSISQAHDVQTQMLVDEANGKTVPFSILTVHAQDHFMTAMLANELITEIIEMHQQKEG